MGEGGVPKETQEFHLNDGHSEKLKYWKKWRGLVKDKDEEKTCRAQALRTE